MAYGKVKKEMVENIEKVSRRANVNSNKFSFRPTTSSIVFTHLNRLSKTKSTGLDSISAKLIRECADIISGPLCDLFNKSLMSGIFPDDWKCARVIPLFKQGESFDLNNDINNNNNNINNNNNNNNNNNIFFKLKLIKYLQR